MVAEKESTGRHVLLRVSSDRRGRSDHQSEPSEGPYTARTCTQGQWHRRPSCWLHPGGAATTGRGRPGAPLRLSRAGCGSDMLRSDLSAARQLEISDRHSVCRLNHRFARDGLVVFLNTEAVIKMKAFFSNFFFVFQTFLGKEYGQKNTPIFCS